MQAAHRIHTSEIGQVFAGQNHPLTDQSHGLVGQMGHAPSGLTHRPMRPTSQEHNISTVLSHAPIKRLPMSQSNNFAGQVKHGFTGRNQPPIAQPPMKHPVLFHTPVEHPPMSQSLDFGGQMAQALPDLHHLSMRPHAQDHNISLVQSHVSMEQVFPSRTHLPIDQSHGVGGQIRHFPQGLNHDPGDFFSGLNHGARIGLNKLDKPMSHTTFMEHDVPELPQHQEGHQEIIDQVSFDLDAEALSCLLEAPSTDCPSSELLSFSFLDEEIRVNLSGSISKLTTDSEFDGVSKDPC